MKISTLRSAVLILAALGALSPNQSSAQETDIAAIRALQNEQAAAWNRHDAVAYAQLFTEDGDVVNVLGWWWKGRPEIERKLADAFAFVFAESRLTIVEVHIRSLEPNYAVAHVRWTMNGAKAPPGSPEPPREGIQLQILRKEQEGWRIVSFQNTNSIPEFPFPSGPPSSRPTNR